MGSRGTRQKRQGRALATVPRRVTSPGGMSRPRIRAIAEGVRFAGGELSLPLAPPIPSVVHDPFAAFEVSKPRGPVPLTWKEKGMCWSIPLPADLIEENDRSAAIRISARFPPNIHWVSSVVSHLPSGFVPTGLSCDLKGRSRQKPQSFKAKSTTVWYRTSAPA